MDNNFNNHIEFAPGVERLPYFCGFANGVRWSDFSSNDPSDYALYFYDGLTSVTFFASSDDFQTLGAPPIELAVPCNSDLGEGVIDVDYMGIRLWDSGSGTAGDTFEFMLNNGGILSDFWQNAYSASGPASDTNSTGALSIGAIDPPNGTSIAPYSSQGPTNDNRKKPDISVASCVSSYTIAPCFDGTSAAAPGAAGAAALLIDAGVATTPAQIKTYLLNNAVDRGATGTDNVFGAGELILPAPPGGATATPPPTNTPVPTNTPLPPTNTPTNTPVPLTDTPTNVPPPADTPTSVVPLTDTPTGVAPPTETPTPILPTATDTPTSTPTFTRTPTRTRTPTPSALRGDSNCDGRRNALDALAILQYSAGLLDELACADGADANGNGRVDASDAALVLQYVAGIIDEL